MKNCYNCGHSCHCGMDCVQNHKDGDGKIYKSFVARVVDVKTIGKMK